jgi:hypothetical protein
MRSNNLWFEIKYFPKLLVVLAIAFSFSCQSGEKEGNTIPNSYSLEIIDSLVVDYLGVLAWADISENGELFLALEWNTDETFLIDNQGKILQKFKNRGDGPETIGGEVFSLPKFVESNSFAVMGRKGIYVFDLHGKLKRLISPEFDVSLALYPYGAENLLVVGENEFLAWLPGRSLGEFYYDRRDGTKLEWFGNEQKGVIPTPANSRFSADKAYPLPGESPKFRSNQNIIYFAFQNEPIIYQYKADLETFHPESISLPLTDFQLSKGKDWKEVNPHEIQLTTRDLHYGEIENFWIIKDQILVLYKNGIRDSEFISLEERFSERQEFLKELRQRNTLKAGMLDKDGNFSPLIMPSNLKSINFIDDEYIWITLNTEIEQDYEVLYKARINSII